MSQINPLWKAAVGNTPFVTASQVGLPDTLRYTYWENIQPRLGIAWKPFHDDNTVIRASGGMYSVPVLGAVLYSLLGVDTSYFAYYPSTPTFVRTFPNVFAGSGTSTGYPSYRRANQWDLKDPRVIQWNFSIDHNLGFNTVARLSYTGSHTYNLIYSPDLNQVAPNTIGYAALTATPALRQVNLKFPNFAEVLTRANGPSDKYDAGTVEVNRRFSSDLSFSNSYTYAKNITNALGVAPSSSIPLGGQGDNGDNVLNVFNIAASTGNAFYDPRTKFLSTAVYRIPVGRGKQFMGNASKAADALIGGWSASSILLYHSGFWLTPYFPSSTADPSGTYPTSRSVGNQNPDCGSSATAGFSGTVGDYFDPKPYSIPGVNGPIGRFGNCGVGILEGPPTTTLSASFGKTFQVTERLGVHYEAQFANLVNINNWANMTWYEVMTDLSSGKCAMALDAVPMVAWINAGEKSVAFDLVDGHIVVPATAVMAGENSIRIEFLAGDESLNRNDEFLYTLFVPARAHYAFPCFDQPSLKARYSLTLDIPAAWQATANGAEIGRETANGRAVVRFAETQPLPTYLFAFAAGKFQVETAERNGRTFRMFHRETDAAKVARNRDAIFDLHARALARECPAQRRAYAGARARHQYRLVPQVIDLQHKTARYYLELRRTRACGKSRQTTACIKSH